MAKSNQRASVSRAAVSVPAYRRRLSGPRQEAVAESLRYLAVSALAFVVDTAVLLTLVAVLGIGHLAAATAGFCCGLLTAWSLSEWWVFRGHRTSTAWSRFGLFALTGLVGLVQLNLLVWLLAENLGLFWSKILATGVAYISSYLLRRAIYSGNAVATSAQGSNL